MATIQEQIAEKANITADQAKLAYDHVMETLKSKVPAGLGDEIHKVMDGKQADLESMKNHISDAITSGAHTLQEKATETYNTLSEKASEALHNLQDQAKGFFHKDESKS